MKKINIAELLKDCPKGMELDCTMYDKVTLTSVDNREDIDFPIRVVREDGGFITLTKYGQYTDANFAKCVIFPKGKTTWEGFQRPFKDGDIVVAEDGILLQMFILKEVKSHENDSYDGDCYFGWDFDDNRLFRERIWRFNRLATEEEKERLFKTIKDYGYRWNPETKTLEKGKEYLKTYEECCEVLGIEYPFIKKNENTYSASCYKNSIIVDFIQLIICRDAYWKIADWKPDWKMKSDNYNLIVYEGDVIKDINCGVNHVLTFPTEEMRDTFYENFMDLINECKELL